MCVLGLRHKTPPRGLGSQLIAQLEAGSPGRCQRGCPVQAGGSSLAPAASGDSGVLSGAPGSGLHPPAMAARGLCLCRLFPHSHGCGPPHVTVVSGNSISKSVTF